MAFAIALQDPSRLSLACHSKWHNLLRAAARGMETPELISVDLGYISRNKGGYLEFGNLPTISRDAVILSIRGDARDYYAARRIFAGSPVRMNGWLSFVAKRSSLIDFPFAKGWFPIRNRYRAWASLAKVPWPPIESYYSQKQPCRTPFSIGIHVGAQWRARQFPDVAKLVKLLEKNAEVRIIAGPADPLPDGICDADVRRPVNGDLVDTLTSCSYIITNDSGPMHLASFLRCRTLVVTRQAAIREWLPPTAIAVESPYSPKGYRPNAAHLSDTVSSGWPSPETVVGCLAKLAC
jgi:hypothetical protein